VALPSRIAVESVFAGRVSEALKVISLPHHLSPILVLYQTNSFASAIGAGETFFPSRKNRSICKIIHEITSCREKTYLSL
jgi:hypothetical protein